MRKVDHERIADAVASANPQYFNPAILNKLKEGSIWPDTISYRKAHHKNRQNDIIRYILAARKYYLKNDFSESAFCLGVAFHYIADGTCPGSADSRHNSWEREISRLPLPRKAPSTLFQTPNHLFTHIEYELSIKRRLESSSFYTSLAICSSIPKLVWKENRERSKLEEELISQAKSKLPDKLSYYLSIIIILLALSLNIFLFSILDAFHIFLCLIATGIVSSIPFRMLYKRKQSVIWIFEWYGLRY